MLSITRTHGAEICIAQAGSVRANVGTWWCASSALEICRKAKGQFSLLFSKRALSDGPLRYANMDYIFWSTLFGYDGPLITVSYDIVCQWHINLMKRFEDLPEEVRDKVDKFAIKFVIPKFHISAHGDKCQSVFSLNFRRHMARTDGENIERGWAHMNPASLSTREMGPGARRDTLDCQWSGWNWRLLVRLGMFSSV